MDKNNPQEFQKFKYSVKAINLNPDLSIILKEGMEKIECQFTLNDIKNDIEALNKKKQEVEGKRAISDGLMQNVKNHGYVEGLTEEQIKGAFIYEKARIEVMGADELLEQINHQIDRYGYEIEEINKQIEICPEKPKQ